MVGMGERWWWCRVCICTSVRVRVRVCPSFRALRVGVSLSVSTAFPVASRRAKDPPYQ